MKKLVEDIKGEGLEKLLGEQVTLFCCRYIYTGKLIGVNDTCILLENPSIVYETGSFDDSKWSDCQSLNVQEWYISTQSIESFGAMQKS